MKIFKIIIASTFVLLFVGCSGGPKGPAEEFKGQSADQIFNGAETALSKKHYEEAVKKFEAMDVLYPFDKNAKQAKRDVIGAYYENDDMDSAIAAANVYIRLYPASPDVDYAFYMKGLANFDRNNSWVDSIHKRDKSLRDLSSMKEAFFSFKELVDKFPGSKYSADCKKRMIEIRETIAKQELSIADYYLERDAFVAAANRSAYVLKNLGETSKSKDASNKYSESYSKLVE